MHASVRSADLKDPGPPIPRTVPATRATGRGRGSGRDRSRSGSAGRGGMMQRTDVSSGSGSAATPVNLKYMYKLRPAGRTLSPPPAVPAPAPSKTVGQLQAIAAAARMEAAAAEVTRAISAEYRDGNCRAELDRSLEVIHPTSEAAAADEDAAEKEALRERIRAIVEAGVRRADGQRGGMLEVCRCLN